MKALRKRFAKPSKKKEPLSPQVLLLVLAELYGEGEIPSLQNHRLAASLCTMFFTLARYEEMARLLKRNVVTLPSGNLELTYVMAKNNHLADNRKAIIVSKPGLGCLCPVAIISSFMQRIKELEQKLARPTMRVFPSFVSMRHGQERLTGPDPDGKPFSYQLCLKQFRNVLDKIKLEVDVKSFGLHSSRSGGATAAFSSEKISETQVQVAGRWVSAETPRGYMHLKEQQRGQVSSVLGDQLQEEMSGM
jgi:hypothetical protein